MITDNKLQDLAMTMAEKDASITAMLYVITLRLMIPAQAMVVFGVSFLTSPWQVRIILPTMKQYRAGKMQKIRDSEQYLI